MVACGHPPMSCYGPFPEHVSSRVVTPFRCTPFRDIVSRTIFKHEYSNMIPWKKPHSIIYTQFNHFEVLVPFVSVIFVWTLSLDVLSHCEHAKSRNTSTGTFYLSNVLSVSPLWAGDLNDPLLLRLSSPLLCHQLSFPKVFLNPFKGSCLNITTLSSSEPVTITEDLSNSCGTCTVGPELIPISVWIGAKLAV